MFVCLIYTHVNDGNVNGGALYLSGIAFSTVHPYILITPLQQPHEMDTTIIVII